MSIVSKTVLDKIYNIVLKNTLIPKEKVFIHTFPLASFSVIRDIFSNYSNFLIVDVTGEVTDMTLIQNDVITKTTTFPSGRNFAIRQLAKAFDVPIEVAESSLHLYTSKKIDEVMSKRIEEVLVDIEKEWSIYLENALLSLSSESILPSRVYLTSDSDVSQLFIDFLKLPKTDTTAIFRKNIDVVHIDKGILSKMYKNDFLTNVNEFIAILAIFYNKIINNR